MRAGLIAAVLSGAPSTVVTLRRGEDILASTEAVGEALLPRVRKGWARVAVGGVAHLCISLFWARVMQRLLRAESGTAAAVSGGAACGAAIAAIDLGLVGRFLPPIRALPGGQLFADHLAYGAIVGWVLQRNRPRRVRT